MTRVEREVSTHKSTASQPFHGKMDGDPCWDKIGRNCDCGSPEHFVRFSRPADARRYDGVVLTVAGPWLQCQCGRWKEVA